MTRTLCSQKIDPTILETVVASRLIPLDNGESAVRPIGVGEVVRRVCGKSWRSDGRQKRMCSKQAAHSSCVRDYGLEARLQYTLCMLYLKQMPLMVYFSLMLQMLWKNLTKQLHYIISTFYALWSQSTLSIPTDSIYASSIQPFITSIQSSSVSVKQCWFADDASGAGSTTEIKKRWDVLSTLGPDFEYFPNDKKCWIISKKAREESVREAFKETSIKCNSPRAETLGGAFFLPAFLDTGLPTRNRHERDS